MMKQQTRVRFFIIALMILSGASGRTQLSAAQHVVGIRAEPDVYIDLGAKTRSTAECFLTTNPTNRDHLLAAVLSANPNDENDYSTVALVSFDGGKNWKHTTMPMKRAADPWVAILPNGGAVLGEIGLGDTFKQAVYYSADGGVTWGAGFSFGEGHDHDMFLFDDSQSRFAGVLYLLTTRQAKSGGKPGFHELFLARSIDNGKNFSDVTTFSVFPNLHFNAKTPIVFSDGRLAIPVVTLGDSIAGHADVNRWEPTQSWLVTSSDGGKTFSQPLFITNLAGRRHNGLAVNRFSKWKDHLYYVFPGVRRNGLYFLTSADNGVRWSLPRRIDKNTGAAAFTDLGAVAVNSNGAIGILWIDRIADPARKCQFTYFTVSLDGGETFLEPVRVSTAPSCPEAKNGWVGQAWPQGGDYCGLIARPDGSFMAMWSDARNGTFQLYRSEIRLTGLRQI